MEKSYHRQRLSVIACICCVSLLLPMPVLAQDKQVSGTTTNVNNSLFNATPSKSLNLSGWSISAGIDYQQFSNNGTVYAESSTNKYYNVSPSYQTGFNLGVGYYIPVKNSDINLEYTHLRTSDTSNAWANSLTVSPGALGPVTWASSNVIFDYDSIDFTAGHNLPLHPNYGVNYYGGLNYTHLTKNMNINGNGLGNVIHNSVGTSFYGVGPTFGADTYCNPLSDNPNFTVYVGVQPSLLYGSMSGYVNTNVNDVRTSENIPSDKVVIPAVGAELGLNYVIPYNKTKFNLRLGYELKEFFGATRDGDNYNNAINASFQGLFFNVRATF